MSSHTKLPRRFHKGTHGTARNVDIHEVSDGGMGDEDYMSFRLEVIDNEGNIKEIIPVEARVKEISGRITEGDKLIVLGRRNRRGLLKPKSIYNGTTNLSIKLRGYSFFNTTLGCLMGLIFTASVVGIIAGLITVTDENSRETGVLVLIVSALAMIISIYITRKRKLG